MNKINANPILKKIPLDRVMDMRASINEHAKKIPLDPKYLGKNAIRILDAKKTIDIDLEKFSLLCANKTAKN